MNSEQVQRVRNEKRQQHRHKMNECSSLKFHIKIMLSLLAIATLTSSQLGVTAVCYFATEMQGEYITQTTVSHMNQVSYTHVNITEDSIPIWGFCHKRIGNNIILRMDSDETSCYKCIHVNLVSRNVLRIHTAEQEYESKCYTNEEKAIATCPTDMLDDQSMHKEIILYKALEYNGEQIKRQYCPINGRYKIMFTIDDGGPETSGCLDLKNSELDNCPSGSSLNLRFQQCTFHDYSATLECLGQWKGHDNENFVAFMNTGYQSFGPKYRCATFVKDPDTNAITMSFTADSLCVPGDLYDRKEILELYPIKNQSVDGQFHQYQRLPSWMYGEFEFLTIDDKQIVYRDQSSFKTYTMKVVTYHNAASVEDAQSVRLLTYSQTQCGEEQYHCVSVHKRSFNVLEFQIGSKTIHQSSLADNGGTIDEYIGGLESICGDQYFDKSSYLTQARLDNAFEMSPCPIDGEFIGFIPDAEDLCARLWSDCDRNDTMNYQVALCGHDEIFDERKYQCLGQWTENNIIYTYAKRLDVPTYECFLGALASSDEIFIKEAGEHCRRDIDPYRYSMQLNKTRACPTVERKSDSGSTHLSDDKPSSSSSPASYETTSSNSGDVEYEYFEDNHLNMNSNVQTSTETKVQVHTKDGSINNQNAFVERANNDLYHVHPKIEAGTTKKTENKSTAPNRSTAMLSDTILITNFALLSLLLPNLPN